MRRKTSHRARLFRGCRKTQDAEDKSKYSARDISRSEYSALVETIFNTVQVILLSQTRGLLSEGLRERARSSQDVAKRLEGKRAAWLEKCEQIGPTRLFVETL